MAHVSKGCIFLLAGANGASEPVIGQNFINSKQLIKAMGEQH
jgi:hypothetical protein